MKPTGDVRKLDELGRIVIPIDVRRSFEIKEGTPIEISVDDDRIVLNKFIPRCVFCGGQSVDSGTFGGRVICPPCRDEIGNISFVGHA
jgi:AbrB family transcriptional regulator, transcriptional pleiotropic regulator of transition state genes